MNIDVQVLALPVSLDEGAVTRLLLESVTSDNRLLDGVDVMGYRVDAADPSHTDGAAVDDAVLIEHASRWVASFVELMQARDAWFEQRIAHRVPLAGGGELLIAAFDLDGPHDAWHEDVLSLAVLHYAPLARAMGVRLPGEFVLDAR
jgi:hypothetical protein